VLAIATAKDRASVRALLDAYGIADLFDDARLLDKETGVSKSAHLEKLQRDFNVDFGEITFVDDKVNHLDAVAGLGVRCALATWGYNGEREVRLARERGYLVCTLDEVEGQLFAALP
jgi:phosphoglycolate phosphatase-like HAD superfamily hydrolase